MSETKKKNKNRRKKLRGLFYNNKFILLFSFVAAIIIWIATSMTVSPAIPRQIDNVPVTLDLTNSVPSKLGLELFNSDLNNTKVTIRVEGKKYVVGALSADDFRVTVQTNSVTAAGKQMLQLSVSKVDKNADFEIKEYSPTFVEAYFDTRQEITSNIEPDILGRSIVAKGYVQGDTVLSSDVVTVTGPSAEVNKIKRVVARVTVDEPLTTTQTLEPKLLALDQYGSEVNNVDFDYGDSSLSLTIPVLKQGTLPVGVNFINAPAKYSNSPIQVTFSPSKLTVAAVESMINGTSELKAGNLDFSKLTPSNNKFTFNLSDLQGVKVLDGTKTVTAVVNMDSKSTHTVQVGKENIQLTNVPDGYTAEILTSKITKVRIVGERSSVSEVKAADVVAQVDLNNLHLTEGENKVAAKISVKNHDDCWAAGSYSVLLKLTKK